LPITTNKTTAEIAETLYVRGNRVNHCIAVAAPIDLPEADLSIDPYVLGLWLGDGTSSSGAFTTADKEIATAFSIAGYQAHKRTGQYDYGTFGLSRKLRLLGLLKNKHIPPAYLRASIKQRLALLQGLMDTDGYVDPRGQCEFTTTSPALVYGASELVLSLGIKVAISEGVATLRGRIIGPKYRLKFLTELPVFRLKRKADRQKQEGFRGTHNVRYIVNVERVKSVPVRCIMVDCPSQCYLAGRTMIPTHNTDALLMGALQYVEVPGYSALLLRPTFAELIKADSLIPRSHQWLSRTSARWNEQNKHWTFPSGARLDFGYMGEKTDHFKYQSSAYQFVGFDELTQFREEQYLYMLSRVRRLETSEVPIRIRAASNPGGSGHQWVYLRFVAPGARHAFIPARLDDNPYLDREEYEKNLQELSPILYRQLRNGEWVTDPQAHPFMADWWERSNRYDPDDLGYVNKCIARYCSWDTAVKVGEHNAYTTCATFEVLPDYRAVLRHVWKERVLGVNLPEIIAEHTARWNYDHKLRGVIIEDESSGSTAIQGLQQRRDWISDLVIPFTPAIYGDKLVERPQRSALWCARGCVLLPTPSESCPWLFDFAQDLFMFPDVQFKDTVDAFNQGVLHLEEILAAGWRHRAGLIQSD
jgi:phage terminase large subunit-like protein